MLWTNHQTNRHTAEEEGPPRRRCRYGVGELNTDSELTIVAFCFMVLYWQQGGRGPELLMEKRYSPPLRTHHLGLD